MKFEISTQRRTFQRHNIKRSGNLLSDANTCFSKLLIDLTFEDQ